jgi:RNA polymerase sigma factor (sigma-70 family)
MKKNSKAGKPPACPNFNTDLTLDRATGNDLCIKDKSNSRNFNQFNCIEEPGHLKDVFNNIYKQYRELVYSHVFRMTHSVYHAEEIVQEVFIRVWIHRKKLESIRDIESWLFIMTKRLVFDFVVKLANLRNFLASYRRSDGPEGRQTDIGDVLIPERCRQLLNEAQEKLTKRERQVYHLRHVLGLPKHDIARVLNIAEPTVVFFMKSSQRSVRNYIINKVNADDKKIA